MSNHRTKDSRPSTELGRLLHDTGNLGPGWAEPFDNVPRAAFLPDRVWAWDMTTGHNEAIDRASQPDAFAQAAEANIPLVTQWDDGPVGTGETGTLPSSSASMPSVVASMLRDLQVDDGMQVLEIGTGTGWNAALLTHRLGDANVVTVEVDGQVAARARTALAVGGYRPEVVRADGAEGWSARAPYDRIIATAGVRHIPPAWLQQVRPGGIIVAPWGTDYVAVDAVVKLTIQGDGTGVGSFTDLVEFMKLRDQRLAWPDHTAYVPEFPGDAAQTETGLTAQQLGSGFDTVRFVVGLCVPDCAHLVHTQDDGTSVAWFYGLTDRSWAAAVFRPGEDRAQVYQYGPRQLWDEVELATVWWHAVGKPDVSRFGLTVDGAGTRIWFDEPGFELRPAMGR